MIGMLCGYCTSSSFKIRRREGGFAVVSTVYVIMRFREFVSEQMWLLFERLVSG